ncbi:hypothetical protein ACLOJK_022458 [Asimina triloba]
MGEIRAQLPAKPHPNARFPSDVADTCEAAGFLQLKDPLESISSRKSSTPKLSSLLALRRHDKKSDPADPTAKFIQELQSDLETVYVGQTCLSWEFLHWQYEKSHELSDSDPHSCRRYNQVAGEFQQFQVLLQRFLENEPFQGPRVQTYVKTRCVLKNLLQVPEIKEDCLKERMEEKKKGHGSVTSEMLMAIIDESMRIFWLFVKADKEESNAILKGSSRTKAQLEDPADLKLFEQVQAELLKREKKLKELHRTGNCLVKKFQKARGDPMSHRAFFFAQVDLRLVSRVLRKSRITSDQLLWCHKKLNKVAFHDRKLHREPSFLPFPCC